MSSPTTTSAKNEEKSPLVFDKRNYRYLIIGIAVVVVGFLLMLGGGSDNPTEFNPEIFSFRRITLAPIVVLAGYGLIFYAILVKKAKS